MGNEQMALKKNYLNCYLEGDDLSENVYRLSRHIDLKNNNSSKIALPSMRFGHGLSPISFGDKFPKRVLLAHLIAINCYIKITGNIGAINIWKLEENCGACCCIQ